MTDFSANVQDPTASAPVTPVYNTCTTADKFTAVAHGRYMLHFKNGATPTGTIFINEKQIPTPPGAIPTAPAGASKWSDLQVSASIGATTERVIVIDDITSYIDTSGFVNIQTVTPTTLTVAIFGPL